MQVTISNQSGNHAKQYPAACNYWKYCSVLRSWAFTEADVNNYWSVTRCRLKVLGRARESSRRTQGLWECIEDNHIKRRPCPSPYHEAGEFSLSIQDQEEADQTNWTPYLCPHCPQMFSSCRILLKTFKVPQTDSWTSLPPPHAGTQAPEMEPLSLVSFVICWWVHSQPLKL